MHTSFVRTLVGACSLAAATLFSNGAGAAIVGSTTDIDFTGGSTTFGYLGQSFTLSDNGRGFPSPVSASTAGTAMYAKDFFGISVFFDPPRNRLVFDDSYLYASYPSATVLSFSGTASFIGLALTAADGVHYGYAEFAGTLFEGYAFQTAPGVGIAAGAALVPEPETVALLGLGITALLFVRRNRKG